MRRAFRIHHDPAPGETVQLVIDSLPEGMRPLGGGWWEGNADLSEDSVYYYRVVTHDGQVTRIDHGRPRRPLGESVIIDRWRPADPTRIARHSALFKSGLSRLWPEARGASGLRLTFRLHEPSIQPGHRVAVVGSDPALGEWDESKARGMTASPYPWWTLTLDLVSPDLPGEYSYLIVGPDGDIVHREADRLPIPPCPASTVVTDERLPGVPDWRGSGVAVPVFSLRTPQSFGVGEFRDLVPFAEWAAKCGFAVIQILPINDTTSNHSWDDSRPYDPISVRALHPLYLDIFDLPGSEELGPDVRALAKELNNEPAVAYERVMQAKYEVVRPLFEAAPEDPDEAAFRAENWGWLGPYAFWSALRDRHGSSDMSTWGPDEVFDPARLEEAFAGSGHRDLEFWCWVQFHLHRQLTNAVARVHHLGLALKGDIPIGVAPHSVETWTRPELFHLGTQTGAPPDNFAIRGQNWGFPTYDWEAMAADDFRWWKDRFLALGAYNDAYRIDHILGFFRIWEIPPDAVDGLLGVFRPCKPLTPEEVATHLPAANIERLTRPMIDFEILRRRFGDFATVVRDRCFTGRDDDLRFISFFGSQADIVKASGAGELDGLGNRAAVTRHLLDLRADAPLMEVEGGFHPRISWQATEAYQRLPGHERAQFDSMADDFFHRRHLGVWRAHGLRSLPSVVDVTPLLPCGEDLGMVPDIVPGLMREMGILSLEIERMPKQLGEWRVDPQQAPYLSVVSPGTHDMAPLRLWWTEDSARSQRYWTDVIGGEGEAPAEATVEVCQAIVASHLAAPAMLAIIQLQDLLATVPEARRDDIAAERVNDPADIHHHWGYRCHLNVDDLPVRDWRRT